MNNSRMMIPAMRGVHIYDAAPITGNKIHSISSTA